MRRGQSRAGDNFAESKELSHLVHVHDIVLSSFSDYDLQLMVDVVDVLMHIVSFLFWGSWCRGVLRFCAQVTYLQILCASSAAMSFSSYGFLLGHICMVHIS